jgi:CheY-like chemotaxis protein
VPDTLLLAEDEPLVRGVLSRYLLRQGFHVLEAEHGEAALRALSVATSEVDVVLTDLDMPRINGYEVIRVLRVHRPDLPVVAMCNPYQAWREGVGVPAPDLTPGVPLMMKPLDLKLLVHTLQDSVADARERRQEARFARDRAARARDTARATREQTQTVKHGLDLVAAALALRRPSP